MMTYFTSISDKTIFKYQYINLQCNRKKTCNEHHFYWIWPNIYKIIPISFFGMRSWHFGCRKYADRSKLNFTLVVYKISLYSNNKQGSKWSVEHYRITPCSFGPWIVIWTLQKLIHCALVPHTLLWYCSCSQNSIYKGSDLYIFNLCELFTPLASFFLIKLKFEQLCTCGVSLICVYIHYSCIKGLQPIFSCLRLVHLFVSFN